MKGDFCEKCQVRTGIKMGCVYTEHDKGEYWVLNGDSQWVWGALSVHN